jgi:hypothetical protein
MCVCLLIPASSSRNLPRIATHQDAHHNHQASNDDLCLSVFARYKASAAVVVVIVSCGCQHHRRRWYIVFASLTCKEVSVLVVLFSLLLPGCL